MRDLTTGGDSKSRYTIGRKDCDGKQLLGEGERVEGSVSDPHSFDPDPIRIQDFDDQKFKEITAGEKNIIFFGSKIAVYLSLGLNKGRPSYRRSL